ncbi:BRO family protein [Curtobacterium sp. ME12]|uniref:BRO family protein n=1 Tax=Curtobacterium sp. ME12 TaxID=2744253 RepID=UPI0015F3F3DC|nr:BRO family protein [Curtobacterium sp. ME12]
MSTLGIFRHGDADLRAGIGENGEPWFAAADVARFLGHRDASNMVRSLDADERGTHQTSTPGGTQAITTVTESGFYQAVMQRQTGRMDEQQAAAIKQFQRWVTHDVLPAIRRTGTYTVQPTPPQSYAEALRELASTVEQNAALEAKVAEDAPKVGYVDTYVASEDLRLLRNVAKSIGAAESALRDALIDHRWIYAEHTDRWSESKRAKEMTTRYSAFAAKRDYFRPVPVHDAPRFKSEVMHTLKVTPKGAAAIARVAPSWGLVPMELAVA